MINREQTQAYYANPAQAESFEEKRFYGAFGEWMIEYDVQFYTRNPQVDYSFCQKILELGCGTGRLTIPFRERFPDRYLCAVDYSHSMLEQLRKKRPNKEIGLEILCNSIESLSLPDQHFDLVFFSRLLMHLEDWRGALAKSCRLSHRYLLLDFPPIASIGGLGKFILDRTRHRQTLKDQHRIFRIGAVRSVLQKNGFQIIALERPLVLPIPLHLKINAISHSTRLESILGGWGVRGLIGAPVYLVAKRIL
ncbi:MAG: class I SAM-dependent methyltransferase [Magnetococcus sp. DMHC-6]